MALAYEEPWHIAYPQAAGDPYPHAENQKLVQAFSRFASQVASWLGGPGFFGPGDFNAAIVPGSLQVQVLAPSNAFLLDAASGRVLHYMLTAPINLGVADGIVASATNYFHLQPDLTWHIDQDNTPTTNALTAFSAVFSGTQATSIDQNPTGRTNAGVSGQHQKMGLPGTKTGAYTFTDADDLIEVDATAGPVTITLPPAKGRAGRVKTVVKIDASGNAVTVQGQGGDLINGAANTTLTSQWQAKDFWSNGSAWRFKNVSGGSSSPTFHGCRVRHSTNYTVADTSNTVAPFGGTEDFDTDGYHDPVTNNSRITIPADLGGKYLVEFQFLVAGFNTTGTWRVVLSKNGSGGDTTGIRIERPQDTRNQDIHGAFIMNLAAGDYIELYHMQSSGSGSGTVQNTTFPSVFAVSYLGA